MSPLYLYTSIHVSQQIYLWKSATVLDELATWMGTQLEFRKDEIHCVIACLRLCFWLMIGPTTWNSSNCIVECYHRALHTCLNLSISVHFSQERIYILKSRTGPQLPVHLNQEWQDTPMTISWSTDW